MVEQDPLYFKVEDIDDNLACAKMRMALVIILKTRSWETIMNFSYFLQGKLL